MSLRSENDKLKWRVKIAEACLDGMTAQYTYQKEENEKLRALLRKAITSMRWETWEERAAVAVKIEEALEC